MTDFCYYFRLECIDYVGALGYHHDLDCYTGQTGNPIKAMCGGKKKINGDEMCYSCDTYDFTTEVCPKTEGCTIEAKPAKPTLQYGAGVVAAAKTT